MGRTRPVLDDVIRSLEFADADFAAASTFDEVTNVLDQAGVDHVIVGGGIDLETRLRIIRLVFESSRSTTVHLNSSSGPESYPPFVRSVLRGLTSG